MNRVLYCFLFSVVFFETYSMNRVYREIESKTSSSSLSDCESSDESEESSDYHVSSHGPLRTPRVCTSDMSSDCFFNENEEKMDGISPENSEMNEDNNITTSRNLDDILKNYSPKDGNISPLLRMDQEAEAEYQDYIHSSEYREYIDHMEYIFKNFLNMNPNVEDFAETNEEYDDEIQIAIPKCNNKKEDNEPEK